MSTYKSTKNKKKNSISRIIIGTMCLLGIGGGCLYTIEQYNEPKLVGTWISKETGEEVTFNSDGTMTLNEVIESPTYQILSPSKMLYNIEEKQFEMYYNLDGRILSWGLNENNIENFDRK